MILLVVIFSFVAPLVRQFLSKVRTFPPPDKRPLPPPTSPDVADEIEEFMRRKMERRQARRERIEAKSDAKPIQAEIVVAVKPVRAEVVAEKPVGGQVSAHVEKYLDEQEFKRRESNLGKEVAQADAEINQHLQQVFDHRVSKLAAVPGEAASPPVAYAPPDLVGAAADIPETFATGLLELVGDPDSLRQAIILSEILHRPEERWV